MNYRSPLFNLILGTVFGALMGSAVTAHLATARAQQRIIPLEALNRKNAEDAKRLADQAEQVKQAVEESVKAHRQTTRDLEACQSNVQATQQNLDEQGMHDRFFTLVYEPSVAQQGNDGESFAAARAVLDLYRPGLGAALGRLQAPAQPGMQLRMVLRGYVRAEQLPMGVHLVYTLNPEAASSQGQVE